MKDTLVVYTDFVCPWCYIGDVYLQEALAEHPMKVTYVMYPLHPETPFSGLTLDELFAGRGIDVGAAQRAIRDKAISLGLEFADRTHTFNSRSAQIIGKAMVEQQLFDQYRPAVIHSYFGRGENISSLEVLQSILDTMQIGKWDASELLENATYQEQVDRDWEICRQDNISGVPSYKYGNRSCFGAQTSASLLELFKY